MVDQDQIASVLKECLIKYGRDYGSPKNNNNMLAEASCKIMEKIAESQTPGQGRSANIAERRKEVYGDYREMHQAMAEAWGAFLGIKMNSWQAAGLMVLFKILRARKVYHQDNYDDARNYLWFMEKMQNGKEDSWGRGETERKMSRETPIESAPID